MESVGLCVRVGELRVDLGLTQHLTRHLEVTDEVVLLASTVGDLDDLGVVGGVLRLDVRVYGVAR